MELRFDRGTLVLEGVAKDGAAAAVAAVPALRWDERTRHWRAPAQAYRELVMAFHERGIPVEDRARGYGKTPLALAKPIVPREHQTKALKAWVAGGRRGVVQLPTGAGKTFLALLAIVHTGRPTLIVVPTIDLLHQWQVVLSAHLGPSVPIGGLGGGERDVRDITVATYDSAALNIELLGGRFGFVVFDECHHLPAPQYRSVAVGAIAPFRLGLSATVARADGKEADIYELVGPLNYEGRIDEMVSTVLAPYDVVTIQVDLTKEERLAYETARASYVAFLRRCRVDFSRPDGWRQFVMMSARLPGGREAMRAYREQKKLAQAAQEKLAELGRILDAHPEDRMIVFTDDNDMAYRIGREFVLPVITHQTRLPERKRMLDAFRSGAVSTLVTSKVLNEGVDVPDARVGVVISGSGAVREHVQRLGRILRHRPGKRAVLYELVARGTSELNVNMRRTRHHAYQGTPEVPR
jgi:superfamily II DNA or RNA helicase